MTKSSAAKWKICISMFLFGTIGVFVRHISMPSSVIALVRGVIGVAFLLVVLAAKHTRLDWRAIKANAMWLCLSGCALGFNWILLFESYRHTSVAVSTLCYYIAPILVILLSPLLLREHLTAKKCICVFLALLGMVCISGVLQTGIPTLAEAKGILLGLAAAVLYASVVLMNKQISGIGAYDKTILQLGVSAICLLPYCLLTVPLSAIQVDTRAILMLVLVGIVHTGVTYLLYFGALDHVTGQTAAMISYLDPVVAILSSVTILQEPMIPAEIIGAVLILGASLLSEINTGRNVVS